MSPILGIWASQNYPRITNSYESIATQTITSTTASITFSSIPSTFKHLQIRHITRDTSTSRINNVAGYFNSDSTFTNYRWHYLDGNGSIVDSGAVQVSSVPISFGLGAGGSNASNIFAANVIDILDYTNTNKNTTIRLLAGMDNNGAADPAIRLGSGVWMNTSAVTAITLYPQATGSFATNSTFALYGIRG